MAAVAPADERTMISERIAPGMLPRVLNSADMTIIFVAIVLFIVNASAIQRAGPAAYTFWILGFLAFLIPGALVTAQLGLMFPQEGSLYVWTQKALGPFWGFFAGFCAWWPGILVMAATGDAVVTIWQFIDTGGLPKNWEQGLVILAVLWFSAVISMLRLRMTQNYANVAVVFYGAAIFVIGLAGILWLIGDGHSATGGFGTFDNWLPHSSTWTLFGLVILALLGIEVPLNMGVEIVHMRAIKKYLFWGSIVVMVGYLWATFGTMMNLPASQSTGGLSDIFVAVQHAFWGSHAWAVIIALIALWFFVSNTVVYNYSFSRLLFVSGLERRMPTAMGRVEEKTRVPRNAIVVQTVLASAVTVVAFGPWFGSGNTNKIFWMLQAAVTVIWCISMVLLFADIYLVKRAFPGKFEEVRVAPDWALFGSGLIGIGASILGIVVTFKTPWVTQWTTHSWRVWLAVIVIVSALVAIAIYAISEYTRRREVPTPTPTPAG
ncbi:MAG TPA: APC family permease [Gaiellaceae bacterium]|jgi:amino acid transporter|nr:APC family permease [Gaiellaceae bacterium]